MALSFQPPPPPLAPNTFVPPTSDLINHFEKSVIEPFSRALDNLKIWFQEAKEDEDLIQTLSQKYHFTTHLLELFGDKDPWPLWPILYPPSRFEENLLRQLQFIHNGVDNLHNPNNTILPTPSPSVPTADVAPMIASMEENITALQEKTLVSLKSYADAAKTSAP